jgi:hypothetical protein
MTTPITPKEIATASIDDSAQSGAGGSSSADRSDATTPISAFSLREATSRPHPRRAPRT